MNLYKNREKSVTVTCAITVDNVAFSYGHHDVLTGVSLRIDAGDVVCLTGNNGSGKSTLLKLIIGQLKTNAGTISVFDSPAGSAKAGESIGYVPQTHVVNRVSFPITVRELVVQGLSSSFGFVKIPRKRHYDRVDTMLDRLGLRDYGDTPFNELSGGLQQRALICRSLINNPDLLVLDEPTVGIDARHISVLLTLLDDIRIERNLTILIVTHERDLVEQHLHVDATHTIDNGKMCHA